MLAEKGEGTGGGVLQHRRGPRPLRIEEALMQVDLSADIAERRRVEVHRRA